MQIQKKKEEEMRLAEQLKQKKKQEELKIGEQ